jgi:hypothetical protein
MDAAMGRKVKKLKPLARVKTFLVAGNACAWIGQDLMVEEWEVERVRTSAPFASTEWYSAAFAAACVAYKRLQRRLPEREVVWSTDNTPVGRPLRLNKSITHHLLPHVAG